MHVLELQYPEYHLCQGRYGMCSKTSECESGKNQFKRLLNNQSLLSTKQNDKEKGIGSA